MDRWAFKLAPQLVGKAQQAFAVMPPDEAKDYAKLKAAILRRYDITEESYRQRFRSLVPKSGETNREVKARLQDLAEKWLKDFTTVETVIDQVILEQLLNTLPQEVRVWVKEWKLKTSSEASQLVDDYVQAQKQNPKTRTGQLGGILLAISLKRLGTKRRTAGRLNRQRVKGRPTMEQPLQQNQVKEVREILKI